MASGPECWACHRPIEGITGELMVIDPETSRREDVPMHPLCLHRLWVELIRRGHQPSTWHDIEGEN
jgi:hypothetical protein